MASAHGAAVAAAQPSFVREKILLGKTWSEYLRSLWTPLNIIGAFILVTGVPLIVYRFAAGLGATTNLSQISPWGLWIGFDMMTGIVLAAGGFTIGATVQIFGLKDYHAIERPAILTAFLGYVMAIVGLVADLGKPWNMVQIFWNFGTTSALFEVAWCVILYSTVLFLEFTLPFFEWMGWGRFQRVMKKTLIALTVLSVMFSSMHQSALGSLFLLAPTKLHPLWYTPFIFIFFFLTAVIAGISMVIVESTLSHKVFADQVKGHDADRLVLGLGKAGALVMFAYFFLKLQGVIDGHAWGHLATGWGAWFLVEIVGFVLVPALLFAYGARNSKVTLVRIGGAMGVIGVALNRLNCSVIAYNWDKPAALRYVPSFTEVWVSITLVTIGVLLFRWIVNRMPILREDPRFAEGHH
jgi:Ni/Fe-hydrogenase subunit HybB-like protein